MKREMIETLLKENGVADDKVKAVVDTIMEENGKDIEAEQSKTAAKENELSSANKTIKELQDTIKRSDGKDPEKLEADLAALQKKYDDEIKAERKRADDLQKEYGLKDALKNLDVLDPDYLIFKHGGIEKFTFDPAGKAVGIEDVIKPYKESIPHIFKTKEGKGGDGAGSNSGQSYNPKGGGTPNTSRAAELAAERNKTQTNPYENAWEQK